MKQATRPQDRAFEPFDYGLYAMTVFAWSLSWYALALQAGSGVANEVNIVWRFLIATIIMFAWAAVSKQRLKFPLHDHLGFAALGILLFSSNFLLFYYGAQYLVSGLLSVVFSLASIVNLVLSTVVMREPPSSRTLIGGLMGFGGIALMFLPEMQAHGFTGKTLIGLGLCVAGTLSFCTGNLVSARLQKRGLPLISMNGWGMVYGTLWAGFLALVFGKHFTIAWTGEYLVSLVFLAVVSTVLAFFAYLTLLGRIGSARAGYATVMFPVFALVVSTIFEGYQWTVFAVIGLALVLAGNLFVIRGKK
ncbi:DMT family transporter [Phyllobacterium leguminum]|uniref:Drug/metabolite transporter (DMT)-like permease n=1 Tax=Phyllobacterium leguminum TaxID=314237 RepID=A0A318T5L5_9HYPH|nr:DMT family transporter [Phyllobacterium leguminum]PYE90379.1 drug/metabolite transporter (DMT)-like permease [Phyllobacterium leguminum]